MKAAPLRTSAKRADCRKRAAISTPRDRLTAAKRGVFEARHALRKLDAAARGADGENRVNALVVGNREAMAALKALRRFFSAQGYWDSRICRIRNMIGSHYNERAVATYVEEELTSEALLESTAASVGALARMADQVVHGTMNRVNGGDLMEAEVRAQRVGEAIDIAVGRRVRAQAAGP